MAKKGALFTKVQMTKLKSNTFDLTHDVKLSCKMGDLIPIMVTEAVPGDRFNISCESLIRFAPLVAPVMHRFDVTMHYFFCPNRLVWPKWEDYITNTKTAGVLPAFPTIRMDAGSTWTTGLANYMGVPRTAGMAGEEYISAIPFAVYQKIWDEFYRDQNLQVEVFTNLIDGSQVGAPLTELITMRKRAWEHDYFTSCLPFAQKGDPVTLPMSIVADVPVRTAKDPDGGTIVLDSIGGTINTDQTITAGTPVGGLVTPDGGDLYAKTSDLTAQSSTISDLRRAFKLQEWLEKAARGGTRYIEFIKSMFGVHSSDKRLQRPEYITGVKSPVVISEVLNTTGTEDLPQGNMAGHAVSVTSGKYGSYFVEEYGYIMGIMSIMPKTAYQQGIPKHFLKINDPFDFYFEQFAHIGEQEVQNKELYILQSQAARAETFGYIPRYAEYKFENNRVAGEFQTTMDFWHEGRIFAAAPQLNDEFIECVPDTRIFAVEDGSDYLFCHVLNKITANRLMSYYGSPHF